MFIFPSATGVKARSRPIGRTERVLPTERYVLVDEADDRPGSLKRRLLWVGMPGLWKVNLLDKKKLYITFLFFIMYTDLYIHMRGFAYVFKSTCYIFKTWIPLGLISMHCLVIFVEVLSFHFHYLIYMLTCISCLQIAS